MSTICQYLLIYHTFDIHIRYCTFIGYCVRTYIRYSRNCRKRTGNREYVEHAVTLMQTCLDRFWDTENGGFFDSEDHVLGMKIKGIEDIPHPSANSICIIVLIKMANITKDQKYMQYAEDSLKAFSDRARDLGISGGYFFCALDAYLNRQFRGL